MAWSLELVIIAPLPLPLPLPLLSENSAPPARLLHPDPALLIQRCYRGQQPEELAVGAS